MKALGWIIAAIFLAGVLVAGCVAVINDEDSMAPVRFQLINHEYEGDRCYRYGDCRGDSGNDDSDYRDDNRRGGISPGPFDRSPVDFRDNKVTICFPFSNCGARDGDDDDQPQEPPV